MVLPRYTPLGTRIFTLCQNRDQQTVVVFKILEGDSPTAEQCTTLGKFSVAVPRLPGGALTMNVDFYINLDGELQVTATISDVTGTTAANDEILGEQVFKHPSQSARTWLWPGFWRRRTFPRTLVWGVGTLRTLAPNCG